ncbi:MAG: Stk1 family PASTA domain-containing Ser/Thr kinase [Oscillospiraceae bacterium]|nr:Stk1 family PASTA domain-containing Ser/Thr kinase [Oscillospiraceae bacterium]
MDNYIGKRLDGRYEITELIGAGGMANVYKATDRADGSIKAVKILREEFLDNEELVRRFKNESKAIGLLSHPNIVKVYDVNFSDSVQYIVMEYIDGITLKEYIDHQGKLTWKDTIFFITQVLRALQHAHDRGIVHRDIKPQNIMITADGSIKVTDFGIARFSRSETRTITDKAIGSVHYISPEQARGDVTDAKTDIYSVGVMMYEMLTGELPFTSDSAVSVAIKQISDTPKSLREIDPDIPEGLEEITLKAMAKDPAKRYQSAAQMLRDIDDFKKNPSIVFEYKYFGDDSPTVYIDNTAAAAAKSAAKKNLRPADDEDDGDEDDEDDGDDEEDAPRRKFPTAILLGITGACVVGALVLLFMVFNMGSGSLFHKYADVDLPDFTNMNITDVEGSASYKNFKFTVVEDYNDEYALGTIYSQSPVPPKKIKENGEITLYVSKGPEKITIPDVVDMKYGEAVTLLQNLGLVVMQESVTDSNYEANRIVKTDPVSGTEVLSGTMITLYVNSQSSSTTTYVPDLLNKTYSAAKSLLNQNGLVIGKMTEESSDTIEKGKIISQSLTAGTRVSQGTSVDIVVSLGVVEHKVTMQLALPYKLDGSSGYTVIAKKDDNTLGSTPVTESSSHTWSVSTAGTGKATVLVSAIDAQNHTYLLWTCEVNYDTETYTSVKSDNGVFNWTAPSVSVSGVTLNASSLSLAPGGTGTLTATVSPDNASNKSVSWSSSDAGVASVDGNGNVTVSSGASAGATAVITVTTADGGKTASCTVTVTG